MHTRITDLNIPAPCRLDERRIEVIANGLPLWNGAELAVDNTCCPLNKYGPTAPTRTICRSSFTRSKAKTKE